MEAYKRTGRILNVSVCPADTNEPARLLNYLTAPQVGGAARGAAFCRRRGRMGGGTVGGGLGRA